MGDQIVGVVWCLSDIIFGSCCDGGLCIGQVKILPLSLILTHLDAVNHHRQGLQLEPL